MASIHFILQGKGGVGKSLSAQLLAQYFIDRGRNTLCYDTDPVNHSFSSVTALNVRHVPILENDEINSRKFDSLMEELLEIVDDGTEVVIDNGASTFVPLSAYMVESKVIPMLVECGHKVLIHVVVVGGQAYKDTMNGFAAVLKHFPDAPVVLWENPWFGNLTIDERPFAETELIASNADQIFGSVVLPVLRRETYGKDIEVMLRQHKTFAEVNSQKYPVMAKQRLKVFGEKIFHAIQGAGL